MNDRFTVLLRLVIRECRSEDLHDLEWFGLLADYREVIAKAFARQQQGEIVMLVAEANDFPVGQVWVDLTRKQEDATGIVWALRVMPCFQNLGIGARLVTAAEQAIRARGFAIAELGVEKAPRVLNVSTSGLTIGLSAME
jgi:ribosomal protein S18 acetylase RimI-like enzyme